MLHCMCVAKLSDSIAFTYIIDNPSLVVLFEVHKLEALEQLFNGPLQG